MFASRSNTAIAAGLISAVVFWGANNVGVKYMVQYWQPFWIGSSRMYCVGAVMLALLRFTDWLGPSSTLTPALRRSLWWQGGFTLAIYVVVFNWSLKFTSASHVALCLGTAPIWALLWEGVPGLSWQTVRRYSAAALACGGLLVLVWPKLRGGHDDGRGDLLAIGASLLWTIYGRRCRVLGAALSGTELTAHTMWRAATWLAPFAALELWQGGLPWTWQLVGIQTYCALFGGVISFALYNNALRHWPTSQVFLFSNLIPVTTMTWAWLLIGEAMTTTFWTAMLMIVGGVVLGQWPWRKKPEVEMPIPNE